MKSTISLIWKHKSTLIFGAVLLGAEIAFARAGGGHSFSGGSHSGGGGGGGYSYGGGSGGSSGDAIFLGDLIVRLVALTMRHPLQMIPLELLVAFIIYKIWFQHRSDMISTWSSLPTQMAEGGAPSFVADKIHAFQRDEDENFSHALFLDFADLLYVQTQIVRGEEKLAKLSPYLADSVRAQLAGLATRLEQIGDVIVAECRIADVRSSSETQVSLAVEFQANYTEVDTSGRRATWYTRETWVFTRARGVLSKTPDKILNFGCPNCGAPLADNPLAGCPSCGAKIDSGAYDWFVTAIAQSREQVQPRLDGGGDLESVRYPTVVDPQLAVALNSYQIKHPEFNVRSVARRAEEIFLKIQKAWTERNPDLARPYETDHLFHSHLYWIEQFKKQGVRNVLEQVRVDQMLPVKFVEDKFYASITFRVYATMIDYTESRDGRIIAGQRDRAKPFSEYWTFMRGQRAKPSGFSVEQCPSCGAELKISMAGVCPYCRSKITSGEFDWVLSLIEQAETYSG